MAREEKTEQAPKKGPSPILLVLLVAALGFVVLIFSPGSGQRKGTPAVFIYKGPPGGTAFA